MKAMAVPRNNKAMIERPLKIRMFFSFSEIRF